MCGCTAKTGLSAKTLSFQGSSAIDVMVIESGPRSTSNLVSSRRLWTEGIPPGSTVIDYMHLDDHSHRHQD
jgi:hypothetical protein